MTANRYQHVPDELQRLAADRLDTLLRRAIVPTEITRTSTST